MKNLLYILFFLGAYSAFAQSELLEGFGDYRTIENAEPGKTYTQAYIPPTFKKVVWKDSVLLLENNQHLIDNLEEGKDYEIIMEIVETHSAYRIWEFEEPTIDTIIETKTIIVDRICEEIEPMPKFENQVIIERQKVFDWSFIFIPRPIKDDFIERCIPYKLRKNKHTHLLTYAMVEIPARYVSIEKRVFQKNGKWWTETIADTLYSKRYRYFTTKVNNSVKHIPAIIDTFYRFVVYEDVLNQLIQPIFYTIQKQIINKEDYFTEWKEVRCGPFCGSYRIRNIQEALIKKGYKVPVDNIFGKETKAALFDFQKANNIFSPNIDRETLKLLGIE